MKKILQKRPAKSSAITGEKSEQERTAIAKAAMLTALRKTLGIVTPACESVGIARITHYDWMSNDPAYKKAVEEIKDIEIDFVESKLHSLINDKCPAAIIFHLKCQGKRRGYVEKQEIEHSGNLGVTLDVTKLSDQQLQAIAEGKSVSGIGAEEEK
jgi:hypothetical protein